MKPCLYILLLCLALGELVHAEAPPENAPFAPDAEADMITKVELERIITHPLTLDLRDLLKSSINAEDASASPDPEGGERWMARLREQGYEFVSYKENFVPLPNGTQREMHELTIKEIKTGEVHTLVLRQKSNLGKDEAVLKFTWDGKISNIVRRVEQKFTLPPEPGVEYIVTSVALSEVKVRRLTDGKEFSIRKPLL